MSKVALITGVGRANSIAYTISRQLITEGWSLLVNFWHPYDQRLQLGGQLDELEALREFGREHEVTVELAPADLELTETPAQLVQQAQRLGELKALVLSHCEGVDSSVLDTTVESWDRHYNVNVRANWLLIKAFAEATTTDASDIKKVVALTSDHTAFNLPYGSSKGALDRLVIASGVELGPRGFRCNLINPGPINTGWMDDHLESQLSEHTPAGRLGTAHDTANVVSFLLSEKGNWINSQLLKSNGGFGAS